MEFWVWARVYMWWETNFWMRCVSFNFQGKYWYVQIKRERAKRNQKNEEKKIDFFFFKIRSIVTERNREVFNWIDCRSHESLTLWKQQDDHHQYHIFKFQASWVLSMLFYFVFFFDLILRCVFRSPTLLWLIFCSYCCCYYYYC